MPILMVGFEREELRLSDWEEKFVIGLTSNIGTGKSVVRRMLEHLGAYGIDADALAQRTYARGAPGHQAVIKQFGHWIVAPDGEIDRGRLGRIVFADPQALATLEEIVHPLVDQAIDFLVKRSVQPVIVIEAIKLLEAGLDKKCNSVWVAAAPKEVQLTRLTMQRRMSKAEAFQRIEAQPAQALKIAAAQVVINNVGSIEDTWRQVIAGCKQILPAEFIELSEQPEPAAAKGEFSIIRGNPSHSAEIAELFNRLEKPARPLRAEDIMEKFGEKAYLLLKVDSKLKAAVGWQVENLVSRATEMVIDPDLPSEKVIPALIQVMERASRVLQCEASLIFTSPKLVKQDGLWQNLGYVRMLPETLKVRAWQDAARESMPEGTLMLFKKLREDRVLRPI
ncbi:MAG: dephospho-CoA kinase [Bellilinea sp.]